MEVKMVNSYRSRKDSNDIPQICIDSKVGLQITVWKMFVAKVFFDSS